MADFKRCPYCAEDIRSQALRCPHCRSRLAGFEITEWHRGHPDARAAGVASALAHALAVPVGLVRVGFVIASAFHLLGVFVYGLLWAVIPPAKGECSALERGLSRAQRWARSAAAGAEANGGAPQQPSPAARAGEMSPASAGVIHDASDGER